MGREVDPKQMKTSVAKEVPVLRRCVQMALAGVEREFPCQIPLVFDNPVNIKRPRDLTPAFYGCYDWHSAVHSHWLLVRCLSHAHLDEPTIDEVRSVIGRNLSEENLAAEFRFLSHPARATFERPYGLAWLLQFAAELRFLDDPAARIWLARIEPLERLAARRFTEWLPKLRTPIRTGEHSQTAFALGLVADWARDAADPKMVELVHSTALRFYAADCNLPIAWEPSGHDFLSPALATADLMRRVLTPESFGDWLSIAMPGLIESPSLRPVPPPADLSDGKLAHFVGLNFSRAWMLDGISRGLRDGDSRRSPLEQLGRDHLDTGIPMLSCNEYTVTHWVGSFAVYALTRAGVSRSVCCQSCPESP